MFYFAKGLEQLIGAEQKQGSTSVWGPHILSFVAKPDLTIATTIHHP